MAFLSCRQEETRHRAASWGGDEGNEVLENKKQKQKKKEEKQYLQSQNSYKLSCLQFLPV